MRLSRTWWMVLVIVVMTGVGFLFLSRSSERRDYKLPDGSILCLEKVYFGKPQSFELNKGWLTRLKERLPQSWVNRFSKPTPTVFGRSSWYTNNKTHTNDDALYVYVTRRDPLTHQPQDVDVQVAQMVDEHGCTFSATQAGGENDGSLPAKATGAMPYSVAWFRFEAFPRHEKQLRLRVFYGQAQPKICEFTFPNPAPLNAPRQSWSPEPFPIQKVQDDVAFTLQSLKIAVHSNYGGIPQDIFFSRERIVPKFEILESGKPSSNWQEFETELYDASGNFCSGFWRDSPCLCLHEPAWKLHVNFFGTEKSHAASNVTWTVRGLQIPGPGEFTNLAQFQSLDGINVKLMALAGTGVFTYGQKSRPAVFPYGQEYIEQGSPLAEPLKSSKMEWGNGSTYSHKIHGKTPHIAVELGTVTDEQRFTVRAIDDQGREFYGYEWMFWGNSLAARKAQGEVHYMQRNFGMSPIFVAFDLPEDAKKIDLVFCLHNCRTAEFIFKPPQPEAAAKLK